MHDALASLATALTWQPTIDRFAHILAYAHAHDIGHPQPDVYAQEHWRRELRAAREMFAALSCPLLDESRSFRLALQRARLERYDIFLRNNYKARLGMETVAGYEILKDAGLFDLADKKNPRQVPT